MENARLWIMEVDTDGRQRNHHFDVKKLSYGTMEVGYNVSHGQGGYQT